MSGNEEVTMYKKMGKKGFSLIELLTVVAIIAILSMIAIPGYLGQKKRATRTEAYANLQNLRLLEEQFFAENGSYTTIGRLTGWKPGDVNNLEFTYVVNGSSPWTTFRAVATGRTATVAGDTFWIDNNNNRNF